MTLDEKLAILRSAALFKGLAKGDPDRGIDRDEVLRPLAAAATEVRYDPHARSPREERFLLWPGQPADDVFFVVEGYVQLCTGHPAFGRPFDEPGLHLALLHAGNLVGDAELAIVAASAVGGDAKLTVPVLPRRTLSAIPLRGGSTTVLRVPVEALARVLTSFPAARHRLAEGVAGQVSGLAAALAVEGLAAQRARPRVARLLRDLFDGMGELVEADDGSGRRFDRLARPMTNGDLARSLGLTTRSVQDDVEALETCGVLGDDGTGRLVLREPEVLHLIAGELDPDDGVGGSGQDTTSAERRADDWRRVIEARMLASPTAAAALAGEAVYAFPLPAPREAGAAEKVESPEGTPSAGAAAKRASKIEAGAELPKELVVRQQTERLQAAKLRLHYQAVLAQLRAGAAARAEQWLAGTMVEWADFLHARRTRFDDEADLGRLREDVRAAVARVAKERAFAAPDPGRRRVLLAEAGEAYRAVFAGGGSYFSAVNAASLLRMAGVADEAHGLATEALRGARTERPRSYWSLATEAEACWLLGDRDAALRAALAARERPDCDGAKLQSTRLQLRRLQAFLPPFAEMLEAFEPDPVLVVADPDGAAAWDAAALARRVADAPGPCVVVAADPEKVSLAVAEKLGGDAGPGRLRLVPLARDAGPEAALAAARRALGLGALTAAALEAPLRLASHPEGVGSRVLHFDRCTPLDLEGRPAWALPRDPSRRAMLLSMTAEERKKEKKGKRGGQEQPEGVLSPFPPEACNILRHERSTGGRVTERVVALAGAAEAADMASAVLRDHDEARDGSAGLRLCLDLAPGPADRLNLAAQPVLAPRAQPGVLYATDEAAAELALLGRDDLLIHSAGRVRVSKSRGSVPLWAVSRIAPLPAPAGP